jgi:hypothetical protein
VLARRLLDTGMPLFRRGARGQDLARIAAAGSVLPRIAGRAVGLVLSVGSAAQRRRSAQVATGVSRALGLPTSASSPDAVQLLTSDDDGSEHGVARALAELAGEGAVILIAGVDEPTAAAAAKYAANTGIPVLTLASTASTADAAFMLGETREREHEALERGARELSLEPRVVVGPGGVSCDITAPAAGLPRFPVQAWKKERVAGVLLTGNSLCARDVARETQESGRRVTLGLSLEAGEVYGELDAAQPRFALAAGTFPHREGISAPAAQVELVAQSGHAPSWYTALGHDAAALARAVLASFPLDRVDDARAVAALHQRAREKLADAEAPLWSTERRGFGGARALPRVLSTVTWKKGKP